MSRISSTAKLNKGLLVKGTGYSTPVQSHSTNTRTPTNHTISGRATNMRRSESVGSVSTVPSTSTQSQPRPTCRNRIPLVPRAREPTATTGGSRICAQSSSNEKTVICNCQHPADIAFLENIYVQNLQTQIEVLELENNFLRTSTGLVDETLSRKSILKSEDGSVPKETNEFLLYRDLGHHHYPSTSTSTTTSITKGSTASGTKHAKSIDPTMHHQRKKVEFADETTEVVAVSSSSPYHHHPQHYYQSPQHNLLKNEGDYSIVSRQQGSTQKGYLRGQDDELFLKLEQAFRNEQVLEEKLNKHVADNRRLQSFNTELEEKLLHYEGKLSRERRSLMEDNVELQKRLDELTPLLAEREAKIAKLEDELEGNCVLVRNSTSKISSLQARLDEQRREESLLSELESDRRLENERLREKIRNLEADMHEIQSKKSILSDEVTLLRQHEKTLAEERILLKHANEENKYLSDTNADLLYKIKQMEHRIDEQQKEIVARKKSESIERDLEQAHKIENDLKHEVKRISEQLEREKETNIALKIQQRNHDTKESTYRQHRQKILNELEALQALSSSLTNENKGLREERIATDERLRFLQNKVFAKEHDVDDLTKKLEEFKRKYTEAINRLSMEIARQNETSEELEDIVKRVHELSNSIPRRVPSPLLSPTPELTPKLSQQSRRQSSDTIIVNFPTKREFSEGDAEVQRRESASTLKSMLKRDSSTQSRSTHQIRQNDSRSSDDENNDQFLSQSSMRGGSDDEKSADNANKSGEAKKSESEKIVSVLSREDQLTHRYRKKVS